MAPRAAGVTNLSLFSGSVCKSCQRSILRQRFASAAAAAAAVEQDETPSNSSVVSSGPQPAYKIRAGVVLSRPPLITRDLHPFEKAFYLYQRRLNERLALPFTRYFYYKKGTPGDVEWKRKIKDRLTPSRDIGKYNPYKAEGWHDELLVGAQESEPHSQIEALLKDAEAPAPESARLTAAAAPEDQAAGKKQDLERPMDRVTEEDKNLDTSSLNRLLQRTLYLVVRNEKGQWTFPTANLFPREALRTAAERILESSGGQNMNTWVVGNHPIGHFAIEFPSPALVGDDKDVVELGEKVFFLKGRVMAGQVDLSSSTLGFTEFKWLAKEEIRNVVGPKYWSQTENMLVEL